MVVSLWYISSVDQLKHTQHLSEADTKGIHFCKQENSADFVYHTFLYIIFNIPFLQPLYLME